MAVLLVKVVVLTSWKWKEHGGFVVPSGPGAGPCFGLPRTVTLFADSRNYLQYSDVTLNS